jgi:ABC-type uncharacterized transport system substrate-binding protein
MFSRLRRLILGAVLILLASAVLVLTDRSGSRMSAAQGADPAAPRAARIAILQFSNIAAFEGGKAGLLEHLRSVGYTEASGTTFEIFNPSADVATLAQMCAQIASAADPYDLVVSLGTATTQAFARANQRGTRHVMGFVASPPAINIPLGPYVAGTGRPASLAGFGTLQPVETLFRALVSCDPTVRRVGFVYNPAEPNAEANAALARSVAKELGLELIEANGATISEITNAADVVLSRGIDAYWLLADTGINAAAPTLIKRCLNARIPTITNFPEMAALGANLCIGSDWHACGVTTGIYAELLLRGASATDLPIENFVPSRTTINLGGMPASWIVPADLRTRASEIHVPGAPPTVSMPTFELAPASALAARAALDANARAQAARQATSGARAIPAIAVLTYNRTPNFEECYGGFLEEWARLGYIDGVNCRMSLRDAQFDAGTLNTMAATIAEERPDIVVPFTTPALQTVLRRVPDRPIVFSLSSSGVAAGAGTSVTDHMPNVTGAQVGADWDTMIEIARAAIPNLRRVGTVYSPGEANSAFFHDQWRARLSAQGIELVSVGADKPTELPEAADALASQGLQAILQIADNSSSTGFRVITKAADRAGIPVFGFSPTAVQFGATLSVARDYRDVGRLTARLVDRVLRGESPADIPFSDPDDTVITINSARLARFGITLPRAVLDIARTGRENERPSDPTTATTGSAPPASRTSTEGGTP